MAIIADSSEQRVLPRTLAGATVLLGNRLLLEEAGISATDPVWPALEQKAALLRANGQTVMFVAASARLLGLLGVAAPARM